LLNKSDEFDIKDAMDVLGLIGTFIRVVENGSIAAAARAKGMSPAAVSQSLSRLEGHLGVRLLSRTTRSMTLTENGKRYFEKVRHIPDDVELASQAAAHVTKPKGPLCIATTAAFGRYVLAPLMPAFKASFPDIDIELISTDRNVSHHLEGVDVSIRIEAQLNDQLIARKIASLPFIFCAAPAYLEKHGTPTTPDDLAGHKAVMFFSGQSRAVMDWRFMQDGTPVIVRPARTMLVDNSDILLSCGLAGLGMLQGIRAILAPHLESGRLVEVLTSYTTVTKPISVLYPDRRYLAPKVRVFIDWLSALFADKSAQLHGLLPPGKQ